MTQIQQFSYHHFIIQCFTHGFCFKSKFAMLQLMCWFVWSKAQNGLLYLFIFCFKKINGEKYFWKSRSTWEIQTRLWDPWKNLIFGQRNSLVKLSWLLSIQLIDILRKWASCRYDLVEQPYSTVWWSSSWALGSASPLVLRTSGRWTSV